MKPGRHREVEVAEELVAVVAVELQGEVAEGAGERVRGAGDEARVEGPDLARAGGAVRARSRGRRSASSAASASASFQGKKSASAVVDRAVGRGRHQAAVGGEEVQVELFERDLRQVVEVDRQLAGLRVGMDRADELGVDAEAVGDHEQPVLVARLRFADVERAGRAGRRAPACRCRRCRSSSCRGSRPGASLPKFACASVQARLPVGGVGVDREPFGQEHGRRADRRGRVRGARGTGALSAACRARRRESVSVVVSAGVEDRVEGLLFAAGGRRVLRLRVREDAPGPGRSCTSSVDRQRLRRCRRSGCRSAAIDAAGCD